jgi:hypothetical protein
VAALKLRDQVLLQGAQFVSVAPISDSLLDTAIFYALVLSVFVAGIHVAKV